MSGDTSRLHYSSVVHQIIVKTAMVEYRKSTDYIISMKRPSQQYTNPDADRARYVRFLLSLPTTPPVLTPSRPSFSSPCTLLVQGISNNPIVYSLPSNAHSDSSDGDWDRPLFFSPSPLPAYEDEDTDETTLLRLRAMLRRSEGIARTTATWRLAFLLSLLASRDDDASGSPWEV